MTLGDRKQLIAVDSEPRGARISLGGSPPITTPGIVEVARTDELKLCSADKGGNADCVPVPCAFRWLPFFGYNLPWLALSPPAGVAYGIGLGIDWASGAARSCPDHVLFTLPEAPIPVPARACRKVLLFPITDPRWDRDGITAVARARLQKSMEPCDRIVDAGIARILSERYALLRGDALPTEQWEPQLWLHIAREAGATHIAFVPREEEASDARLTLRVADAFTRGLREEYIFEPTPAERSRAQATPLSRALNLIRDAFPNAVDLSTSRTEPQFGGAFAGNVTRVTQRKSRIPAYITGLGLRSVEHPDSKPGLYAGLRFSLGLRALLLSDDLQVKLPGKVPADEGTLALEVLSFTVPVAYELVLHSGLGAFTLRAAIAPFLSRSSLERSVRWTLRPAVGADLEWTAFLGRRLFLAAKISALATGAPIATVRSAELNGMSTITLSVGYYYAGLL